MKILILENDQYMSSSKDTPVVGRYYSLEDAISGSRALNNTFHALIDCLYIWMLKEDNFVHDNNGIIYDFRCANKAELKNIFKQRYGAGADHYEFVDMDYKMVSIKDRLLIPVYVTEDFMNGNKQRIKQILKSWSQYTHKQQHKLVDTLINIMDHIGVDSKKYFIILDGMKENNNE